MSTTSERIKELKTLLPSVKERVAAMGMMLAMAIFMIVGVSFAWVSLSSSPEAAEIETTIASNGNLEIALSDEDGMEPDKSAVGDSTSSGRDIKSANLRWGNLVNLTQGYGLNKITLRPALLELRGLASGGSPVKGAAYSPDGRITTLNTNYEFTTWQTKDGESAFMTTKTRTFGVRAISSVKYINLSGENEFKIMCDEAEAANGTTGQAYVAITQNDDYMKSLSGLMGEYVSARFGGGLGSVVVNDYIDNFYKMMLDFKVVMDMQGENLAALANIQQFLKFGKGNYTPYTGATLRSASTASLTANGVSLSSLVLYKTAYTKLTADITKMNGFVEQKNNGTTIYWPSINSIVNNLVNIGTCEIDGMAINSIGISQATSLMSSSKKKAIIKNGMLRDFEELNGAHMKADNVTVTAKALGQTKKLTAVVTTDLAETTVSFFLDDLDAIKASNTGSYVGGDAVAGDTYGMAIDLWVRTNGAGLLTLEGNVPTVTTYEDVIVEIEGKNYELYTTKVTIEGETEPIEIDVVKIDNVWYSYSVDGLGDSLTPDTTPIKKQKKIVTPVGAEGENRVWPDNGIVDDNSTTQGNGSFYVYYANTPEDMARSRELLSNIKLAFVDSNNESLATASLLTDDEHFYAVNGKCYVPISITSGGVEYKDKLTGEKRTAIAELSANQAKRIMVILYLDGSALTNDKVLASSDIQGKLNIQFGSTAEKKAIDDQMLQDATRSVTATADKTAFNFDTDTNLTTNITLKVLGTDASNITARFQRAISSTQGTQMPTDIVFSKSGNDWVGSYTFTAPGEYVLRTVTVNGADIDLETPIRVTVEGFTIESILCDKTSIITADATANTNVSVIFASHDVTKMPRSVEGRFSLPDGNVSNVSFKYNSTNSKWEGTATFGTSGVYTLKYLILDGDYFTLTGNQVKTVTVYLGMKANIRLVHNIGNEKEELRDEYGNIVYETDENGDFVLDSNGQKIPIMVPVTGSLTFKFMGGTERFDIEADILDDTGNKLTTLSDTVKLYYHKAGSGLDENGLIGNLTYSNSAKCYTGAFNLTKAGIYDFDRITVGNNTVTQKMSAPTITAQTPEPPSYISASTSFIDVEDNYIFAPNGDAAVAMNLKFSSSARIVKAYFTKEGDDEIYTSVGTMGGDIGNNINRWTFPVPEVSDSQDGIWKLTKIDAIGVYDTAGTLYEEDNPYTITISDSPTVKVVNTIKVEFAKNQQYVSGKDAEGNVTASFMDKASIPNGFKVVVSDRNDKPLKNVTDVKLTLSHIAGTNTSYGGYTVAADQEGAFNNTNLQEVDIDMSVGADNITYSAAAPDNLRLAGKFTTSSLSFKVNNTEFKYDSATMPANSPTVEIYSKIPEIKITATDPAPGTTYKVNMGGGTNQAYVDMNNYFEDHYAYLGFETSKGFLGIASTYDAPKVTLALSDAGGNFTQTIFRALASTYNCDFTFSKNNTSATDYMGRIGENDTSGSATRHSVNANIKTVLMTYGGVQYTVNLQNIIQIRFNNTVTPSLTYVDNSSYPNKIALPDVQKRSDGRTLEVTLPESSSFVISEELAIDQVEDEARKSVTSSSVYTSETRTEGSGCDSTNVTYYKPYNRTVTKQYYTSSVKTVNKTYKVKEWIVEKANYDTTNASITGWTTVGTYAPGKKINVTGNYRASPVIELDSTDDSAAPVTTTQIKTTTLDVANGSETKTKPSGTLVTVAYTSADIKWENEN